MNSQLTDTLIRLGGMRFGYMRRIVVHLKLAGAALFLGKCFCVFCACPLMQGSNVPDGYLYFGDLGYLFVCVH